MNLLEVGLGAASVAVGAVAAWQPGVLRWLTGKLKRDRSAGETDGEPAGKTYELGVRFLQVVVPLVLGVAGVIAIVRGL